LRLEGIVEKPGPEHAPSDLAVCARYVFSPDIFSHLRATAPGHGGEIQLTDAIRSLISAGLPVLAVPLQSGEERLDVGNQQSYARAFLRVALADAQLGEPLRRYLRGLL
jgi:UTP--glucose-1-phosphate uridylyltransferase